MAINTKALADNDDFTLFQYFRQDGFQFLRHGFVIHLTVGTTVIAAGHDIQHTVVLTILERSINTYMMSVGCQTLTDLVFVQLCSFSQLAHRRVALVFLFEAVDFVVDFVQTTYLIERQTNDTTLLSNSLEDALTDPPYGVADELKSTCFIKFLCGLDQADVTLVN